jgi:hypothetical protein
VAPVRACSLDGHFLRHDRRRDYGHSCSLYPGRRSLSPAPAPWLEGLWQVAWGVVGLALYIEAGRTEYKI